VRRFHASACLRASVTVIATLALSPAVTGCGSGGTSTGGATRSRSSTGSASSLPAPAPAGAVNLPGTGKPPITIGDKNFTEQFLLGELYRQALQARGYQISVNRNIGPTEVTIPAVKSGRIDLYPEYLSTWNNAVAGLHRRFGTEMGALRAGRQYAASQGLALLRPTLFSNTPGIAVNRSYATANALQSIADLARIENTVTLGGPPQFQQAPDGLPALAQAYGLAPSAFTPLEVGAQYQALDQGKVQAADVNTTDGQLAAGRYRLLRDPDQVFGSGNVVPVVSMRAMLAEGPAFSATIDRVDALLSVRAMRRLNAAVDAFGQTPAVAAAQFLQAHGLIPPPSP